MPNPCGVVLIATLYCQSCLSYRLSYHKIDPVEHERSQLLERLKANADALKQSHCQSISKDLSTFTATELKSTAEDSSLLQDLMQVDIFKLLQFRDVDTLEFLTNFQDSFTECECRRAQYRAAAAIPGTILSIAGLAGGDELLAQVLEPGVEFSESVTNFAITANTHAKHVLSSCRTIAEIYEWYAQSLRSEVAELRASKAKASSAYWPDVPIGYIWEAYQNLWLKDQASQVFGRPMVFRDTELWNSPEDFITTKFKLEGHEKIRKPRKLRVRQGPLFVTWKGERFDEVPPISVKNGTVKPNLVKVYFDWSRDSPYLSKNGLKDLFDFRNPKDWTSAWVQEGALHSQAWYKYNPSRLARWQNWTGASNGAIHTCCRFVPRIHRVRKESQKLEKELYAFKRVDNKTWEREVENIRKKLFRHQVLNRHGPEAIGNQCKDYRTKHYKHSIGGKETQIHISKFRQLVEPGDILMFVGAQALDHGDENGEFALWEWELADGRGCMRVPRESMEGPLEAKDLASPDHGEAWSKREGALMSGKNVISADNAYNSKAAFASRVAFHLGMGVAGFFTFGTTWAIQGGVGLVDAGVGAGLTFSSSHFRRDAALLFMESLYNQEHRLLAGAEQTFDEWRSTFCSIVPLKKGNTLVDNFPSEVGDPVCPNKEGHPQYCLRYGAFVPGLPLRMNIDIPMYIPRESLEDDTDPASIFQMIKDITKSQDFVVTTAGRLPRGDGKFGFLGVCVPRRRIASELHQRCVVDADCLSDYCRLSEKQIGGTCEQPCLHSTKKRENQRCVKATKKHKFGYYKRE